MESVKVRIKGSVTSSRYGAMRAGDIISTDAEYAKHLVETANAGEYVTDGDAADPEQHKAAGKGKPAQPKE